MKFIFLVIIVIIISCNQKLIPSSNNVFLITPCEVSRYLRGKDMYLNQEVNIPAKYISPSYFLENPIDSACQ